MFVRRIERLPPLAWLLDLRTLRPTLVCGPDVEVFEDGFFEGCWAGDFSARDFDTARHVFGSGARQVGKGWLVVSPSHTMEAIYLLSQQAGPLVSNSLAFLCAWAEIELPFDRGIAARLFTASDGVGHYVRELFQGPGWSIHRACFDNLAIGPDGVRYLAKPGVEARFTDFSAYETYLLAALALVVANGADPRRRFRYELSSTCSSGYNSTACTALAAKLGARRAFTIRGARGGGSDSGRPVIERLGLEVIEVDRPLRPKGPSVPEAEFIATGMSGAEFPLFPLGPHLRHTILLSGFFGGDLWGLEGPVSRTGRQDDTSGGSMAEFRLRCGFVHLPMAWIGFESLPELRRLCHSEAMKAWRTGTGYERPIARRLVGGKRSPARRVRHQKACHGLLLQLCALLVVGSGPGRASRARAPAPRGMARVARLSTRRTGANLRLHDLFRGAQAVQDGRLRETARRSARAAGPELPSPGAGRIRATAASRSSGGRRRFAGRYPKARCGTEGSHSQL